MGEAEMYLNRMYDEQGRAARDAHEAQDAREQQLLDGAVRAAWIGALVKAGLVAAGLRAQGYPHDIELGETTMVGDEAQYAPLVYGWRLFEVLLICRMEPDPDPNHFPNQGESHLLSRDGQLIHFRDLSDGRRRAVELTPLGLEDYREGPGNDDPARPYGKLLDVLEIRREDGHRYQKMKRIFRFGKEETPEEPTAPTGGQ